MKQLTAEVSDVIQFYFQQKGPFDISPVLEGYCAAFDSQFDDNSLYPTLFNRFTPVIDIAESTRAMTFDVAQDNLNLQNNLRIERPKSNHGRILTQPPMHRKQLMPTMLPQCGQSDALAQTKKLPYNLPVLKSRLERSAPTVEQAARPNGPDQQTRDLAVARLQAFARCYLARGAYRSLLQGAIYIQSVYRMQRDRERFKKTVKAIVQHQDGLLLTKVTQLYHDKQQQADKFIQHIFDERVPHQNAFPFCFESEFFSAFNCQIQEQVLQQLKVQDPSLDVVKISQLDLCNIEYQQDVLIDIILVLSQQPDSLYYNQYNTDVSAVLSTFCLLESKIVASLVIICQSDVNQLSYFRKLTGNQKPALVLNCGLGLESVNGYNFDTFQLFNINKQIQKQLKAFYNQLALQRKIGKKKCRYVNIGFNTSNSYAYYHNQEQMDIFTQITKIPVSHADSFGAYVQIKHQLLDVFISQSEMYQQTQIGVSRAGSKRQLILARQHFLPVLSQAYHANKDSFYIELLHINDSRARLSTVSNLKSRLSSNRAASKNGAPRIDIQYNNSNSAIFSERENPQMDEQQIKITAVLPISEMCVINSDYDRQLEDYIVKQLEIQCLQAPKFDDYRLFSINLDAVQYKIMKQTLITKNKETIIKGQKQQNIIDITDIDHFRAQQPDTVQTTEIQQIVQEVSQFNARICVLVVNILNTTPAPTTSFILTAEALCECQKELPFRCHGFKYPAQGADYQLMKGRSRDIVDYLYENNVFGFVTLSFIISSTCEAYDIEFGVNPVILRYYNAMLQHQFCFNAENGELVKYQPFSTQAAQVFPFYTITVVHDKIRRVDKSKLSLLFRQFSFDSVCHYGWVYDISDNIVATFFDDAQGNFRQACCNFISALLKLIHEQFPDSPTSILQNCDRNGDYQRDVECCSNCIGILRMLK